MGEIVLDNVSLEYATAEEVRPIFLNLSVDFGPNGLICIIGESGSGKSTLLNLLASYLTPNEGRIDFSCSKDEIGVIFQNLYLLDHLNALDNVALPLIVHGQSLSQARLKASSALLEVGLEEFSLRKIDQLSGGQKARVGIARCLVTDSQIILADEPTGSLDSYNSTLIMELLKKLSAQRLVILVSHNEKQAEEYSNKVYKIKDLGLSLIKNDDVSYQGEVELTYKPKSIRLKENILLSFSFLKKRMLKVLLGLLFVAICFGVILTLLTFQKEGKEQISSLGKDCLDYTSATVCEKKVYSISGQEMKLMKKVQISPSSQKRLKSKNKDISFYPCLDYFLPAFTQIKVNERFLESSFFLTPAFMEDPAKVNGKLPKNYSEVVVNNSFIASSNNALSLNSIFSLKADFLIKTTYQGKTVSDVLNLDFNFLIKGISKEKDIVSRPTIYYSYFPMKEFIFKQSLYNASVLYESDLTLKERIENLSDEDDSITSFKTLVKMKDPESLLESIEKDFSDLTMVSMPLQIVSSFKDILSSFSKIILLFMFMAVGCSVLLELVVIEDLFFDKREELAIYLSFHINKKQFFKIGQGQVWILSCLISLIASFFNVVMVKVLNILLVKNGLSPFMHDELFSFYGILLIIACFLCAFITNDIPLRSIYSDDLVLSLKGE